MIIVMLLLSSLAAIRAQCIVSIVSFGSGGWASPRPSHFDDCASPDDPNIMSRLCGEL